MQIPYLLDCLQCKTKKANWANINDTVLKCICSCGYNSDVMIRTNITTGVKILYKAGYELDINFDYDMSIVLSVMAFEAEQFRLYKKWYALDGLIESNYISSDEVDSKVREIFIKAGNVRKKINLTFRKALNESFNEYIHTREDLLSLIRNIRPGSKEGDVLGVFHELLFQPRNDIVHGHIYKSSKENALIVYNMARNGILILRDIDKQRRNLSKV